MYKKTTKKACVGKRQLFRRVAEETSAILKNLKESKPSTIYNNVDLSSDDVSCSSRSTVSEVCRSYLNSGNFNLNIDNNIASSFEEIYEDPVFEQNVQNESIMQFLESGGINDVNENYHDEPILQPSNSNMICTQSSSVSHSVNEVIHKNVDLCSQLKRWAGQQKVSHSMVTDLLHILAPLHPELPLDCRTLLRTPVHMTSKKLENGEYCHFGLSNVLKCILPLYPECVDNKIQLSINIDGLPLFSSSKVQFWPILGLVRNIKSQPFAIGIFCGKSKPSPLKDFLQDFINDVLLLRDAFEFNNKVYSIEIINFICDCPAKAYLKCVKSHGGYSSCDKCWESGDYVNGKVILKGIKSLRRTDLSFVMQQDEDHHMGASPLLDLEIGLVSTFTIDYMHAVCLGVMKRLLTSWVSGNLKVRLGGLLTETISKHMLSLRAFMPSEFNRKPRSLCDLAYWKATEFRTFLLYLGPLVLKSYVNIAVYEHFLLLHTGVSILISSRHISSFGCERAQKLINMFINHCEHIYGLDFYVYNVHILTHLEFEVQKYGPLDSFSAFPFENYLGCIKRLIRSPHKPLEQIYRRLKETNFCFNIPHSEQNDVCHYLEHNMGPVPPNILNSTSKQFKKLTYKAITLAVKNYSNSDAYYLNKDGLLIELHNIIVNLSCETILVGKKFLVYESLYSYPFDSKTINIYVLENLSGIETWSLKDLIAKCILFPNGNKSSSWVSFPLLHVN